MSNEVRIGPVTRAQVVADFYCSVAVVASVTCTKCGSKLILNTREMRYGEMIEWLALPVGWTVLNREPYCPAHTVTITVKEERHGD